MDPIIKHFRRATRVETMPSHVLRIYDETKGYTPLGFGYANTRFSSPSKDFAVIYTANDLIAALLEVVIRDTLNWTKNRAIPISELEKHRIASLKPPAEMTLLRLDKNLCSRAGIDTDVIMSSHQDKSRQLSQTLFDQITSAEGILYPSRFRNNDICLATYIKPGSTPPFDVAADMPLIKHPMLKPALIELDIVIDEDH
ncbi:RES domain-containing protein [Sphingorhabdus sp. IMCC26285]|uniref:RES domain-containing protein n=1 Tax=Sphingorhabdus profundilacus TaxID=2509718 RepID=A0A6I4LYG6_9SPHN|nr:RES family NAD+ phosphorylase [Sphingorhabdus profundilacus]MVZ97919.1 RES domain-containing protein [Sphingorhabdus profundilacus]